MPGRLSPGRSGLGLLARALVIVGVLGLVGVLAGVAWEWVWRPPTGVVFSDRWVLEPAGPDLAFSGTGWYVVVAGLAGLLSAAVIAWLVAGHELLTLASVVVGSVLAGWLMLTVGQALGPGDPQVLAVGRQDYTELPSDLRLADDPDPALGSSALVAFPFGALAGLAVVFLSTRGRAVHNPPGSDGTSLR